MTLLRTEATGIVKRPLLPSLPSYQEDPIIFSSQDIAKIIQQITIKGVKYSNLRKSMNTDEGNSMLQRLQESSFVKVMVRKVVIKMGEERRLGNSLRGFSRLLLEQIENQCWPLILIEKNLLQLAKKEQQQISALSSLLQKSPKVQNLS